MTQVPVKICSEGLINNYSYSKSWLIKKKMKGSRLLSNIVIIFCLFILFKTTKNTLFEVNTIQICQRTLVKRALSKAKVEKRKYSKMSPNKWEVKTSSSSSLTQAQYFHYKIVTTWSLVFNFKILKLDSIWI